MKCWPNVGELWPCMRPSACICLGATSQVFLPVPPTQNKPISEQACNNNESIFDRTEALFRQEQMQLINNCPSSRISGSLHTTLYDIYIYIYICI